MKRVISLSLVMMVSLLLLSACGKRSEKFAEEASTEVILKETESVEAAREESSSDKKPGEELEEKSGITAGQAGTALTERGGSGNNEPADTAKGIGEFGITGKTLTNDDAIEIADNLGGMVCALEVHDYDGDGTMEAFTVVGSNDDFDGYMPEALWFIAGDGTVTKLRDDFKDLSMYKSDTGYYMEYAALSKGFFTAECGGYGSGWLSLIFGVKNGEPYEMDISMETEGFYQDKPGVFYTLTDDFTDGHKYLITELEYDSESGQFVKGRVTDRDWASVGGF